MPSVLAIVSKAVFKKEASGAGVGDVYATSCYRSNSRGLDALAEGDDSTLFLVLSPDGDALWLVAELERPQRSDEGWVAAQNARPIEDITALLPKLELESGKGVSAAPGRLGMSLQTPRVLAEADVALLRTVAGESKSKPKSKSKPEAKAKAKSKPGAKSQSESTSKPRAKPESKSKPKSKPKSKSKASGERPVEVVQWLLEVWQRTRAAEVARVVGRYARAHESEAARELRALEKISQKQWLEAARRLDVVDRGALLEALFRETAKKVGERVDLLAQWSPDPRIVDALHAMLEQLPWISSGSRAAVWTRSFKLLKQLADPRTLAVAKSFDPAGIVSTWSGPAEWFGGQLERAAKAIETRAVDALSDEESARLAIIVATLPEETSDADTRSVDELLAAVVEEPDSDDVRLVLADKLKEIDDPRGELIELQYAKLNGKLGREQRKREKAILKEHHDHLLGPLAPVAMKRGLSFERGFVHSIELKPNLHASNVEALAGHPLLSTIRTMTATVDLVLQPACRSLRDVTIAYDYYFGPAPLERIFGSERPLPFTSLDCHLALTRDASAQKRDERLSLLGPQARKSLPALQVLTLRGVPDSEVPKLLERDLCRAVSTLRVGHPRAQTFATLVADSRALSRGDLRTLVAEWGDAAQPARWLCELRVERSDSGALQGATIYVEAPPPGWQGSFSHMCRAAADALESVIELDPPRVEISGSVRGEAERESFVSQVRGVLPDPDNAVVSI